MTEILFRTFPVALEVAEGDDGRTLHGCVVPYEETALVADLIGETFGEPYEERFAREAFARDPRLTRAPNRVELRYEHGTGLFDSFGHGLNFEEKPEGLWGSFRALETHAGDQALALQRAGILRFFSVGFAAKRSRREGGVMVRYACRIDEVSLVREAAYRGTEVAVRSGAGVGFERPARDADLDRRLALLGLRD